MKPICSTRGSYLLTWFILADGGSTLTISLLYKMFKIDVECFSCAVYDYIIFMCSCLWYIIKFYKPVGFTAFVGCSFTVCEL